VHPPDRVFYSFLIAMCALGIIVRVLGLYQMSNQKRLIIHILSLQLIKFLYNSERTMARL